MAAKRLFRDRHPRALWLAIFLCVVMLTLVGCAGTPTATPQSIATATERPAVQATATQQAAAPATATALPTAPATATPLPPTATALPTAPATATAAPATPRPSPALTPAAAASPVTATTSSGQQSAPQTKPGAAPAPPATGATPAPARALAAGVLFNDDFSSQQASESMGWTFSSDANVDVAWSAGSIIASIKKTQWISTLWSNGSYQDFGAEMEGQPLADGYAQYGLVFRVQGLDSGGTYYVFGVDTDGKYFVWKRVAGSWITPNLVDNTASPYIKQGKARNIVGVVVQGSAISLYINRFPVTTINDTTISGQGFAGMFASSGANQPAAVSFSKMTVLTTARAGADWGVATAAAPAPTPAPATPTAARAVTPAPATPALAGGVLFSDDFSSLQSSVNKGWDLEPGNDSDYAIAGGKLTIAIVAQNLIAWTFPTGSYDNFAAETVAQPIGNYYAEYGLIFRLSGDDASRSYYLFGVSNDGQYFLWARKDGDWIAPDPVPYTDHIAVAQDKAANTLGVIVQGNVISLYVNHVLVKAITDKSVTGTGLLGVFAASGDFDTTTVAFDAFTILTPDKARAEWGVR
jgi:hypothetical protein